MFRRATIAGFNVAFFPMHLLGLQGMPRRVYTYPAEMGWGTMNFVATLGAAMIAVSVLLFIVNLLRSRRYGLPAGPDPWGGGTLKWATSSPPAAANFDAIPVVHGSNPVWEDATRPPGAPSAVGGLAVDAREQLVTSVLDAQPDHRSQFPEPSIWPFLSAVATAVLFVGSIFTPWAVVWGVVPLAAATTAWFWPRRRQTRTHVALERQP